MAFTDIAAAQAALTNPTTMASDLMSIAQAFPSLWADVARHPNAYPDLLAWLDQVGGDDVHQAIASRNVMSGLPPVPPPAPPAFAEPATPFPAPAAASGDSGSFGWAVLGFFVPIVGLILWLVWMHTRPRDAKMSRNGFITGIAVAIIASIVSVALVLSAAHRIADETYLPNLPETTDTNEEYPTTIPTPDSVGQSDAGNCVWTDNQTYGVGFCADSQLLYYTDTDYDYYAATNVDVPMIMVSKMEPSQAYQPGDTPADVAYWYSTEAANPCLVLLSTPEVAAANCTSDVVGASHDAGVTFYLLNARGEMIRIDLFSGDSSHGAEQLAAAAVLNPKSLG